MAIEIQQRSQSSMTLSEFKKLSTIIDRELGIKMPEAKRIMLEARLQKRLRILELDNFDAYIDYLENKDFDKKEKVEFRNLVTTNKTDFFRENNHFEYMTNYFLPQWAENNSGTLKIWTCACSSGEEPYTLAMVMEEFRLKNRSFDYHIIATDISTRVLALAKEGVYTESDVKIIPKELQKRYFLKGTGGKNDLFRIKESLKSKITFGRFNLMSAKYQSVPGPVDALFCRNVLIYFDRDRQTAIITQLLTRLKNQGVLFLGHSESMAGMNLNLKALASSIYTRR